MRYRYVLLLLLFIPFQVLSQHILVLEKPGTTKRVRFFTGSEITFEYDNDVRVYGIIKQIKDSTFTVDEKVFSIKKVKQVIFPKRKRLARSFSKMAFTGGFTSLVIAGLDRSLNQRVSPIFDGPTLRLVGTFWALGGILWIVPEKKYAIPKRRVLRSINITPG